MLPLFGHPATCFSQTGNAPPSFTTQPTNQVLFADDTATLQAEAASSAPVSYQWLFNGALLPNATNLALSIPSIQTNHAGAYYLVASNIYGASTSSVALLTVREVPQFAFAHPAIGTGTDRGTGLAVDNAGNIYVLGTYSNALNFGTVNLQSAGGNDIFMARFDHHGQLAWAKTVGGPGSDSGSAVGVDPFGFIYFSGSVTGLVNFDGRSWTNSTDRLGFLAKYNSAGALLWVRTNSGAARLAFDKGGNLYALASGPAIFEKYDTNGTLVYRQWADTSPAAPQPPLNLLSNRGIAVDQDTNIFVVSRFSGTLSLTNYAQTNITLTETWNFRPPTAVLKFNADGQALLGSTSGRVFRMPPRGGFRGCRG